MDYLLEAFEVDSLDIKKEDFAFPPSFIPNDHATSLFPDKISLVAMACQTFCDFLCIT